jgi:hypothetical protein
VAENILVLTPVAFTEIPADRDGLVALLREEQFIGDPLEVVGGEEHYSPGEEFMMLVTFLGCSPMIATGEMESGGEQYCHIAIEGPLERPHYLVGDNIKIPRCPSCGHRFDDWQALLNGWQQEPDAEISCPECGGSFPITKLRWRKCAGFGRFFIKVWGIFESEAVPSPNLLAALKQVSGVEWQHFYIRKN